MGARALGEFGDDPNRFVDAKPRKNYPGTSPITRASGKHRVVLARYARNKRLADTCFLWAFGAITASRRRVWHRWLAAHIEGGGGDGKVVVVEVWESRADQEGWIASKLGPALGRARCSVEAHGSG